MAFSTHDIVPDSPTNNFAVCNVNYAHSSATISNGALSITGSSSFAISTIAVTSGIWYFECHVLSTNGSHISVAELDLITHAQLFDAGNNSNAYGYYANGQKSRNGTFTNYGNSHSSGDILGCCFDLDNGKIYFSLNGSWVNGNSNSYLNLSSITEAFSGLSGTIAPKIGHYNNDQATTFNAGQDPTFGGAKSPTTTYTDANGIGSFYYQPPTGALALCTANLPDFTPDVADDTPQDYFKAVIWGGNNTSQNITDVGFQPDLVWWKGRGPTQYYHNVTDSVRGVTKQIFPNDDIAEETNTTRITGWLSNGFSIGNKNDINTSGQNYVAWCWKAGGAAVTNNDGSITSTVSANTDAGFSIVTATAGSSGTNSYGHGLGVKPSMYIVKNIDSSQNWQIWHQELANETTNYLQFTNNAESSFSSMWAASTATTISLTSGGSVVGSANFVAYVFAEVEGFSKFGSYTGNGSTDGPFVYCGFRPAWVMCKCISDATTTHTSWAMYDNARDSSNVMNKVLYANETINEGYRGDASTAATDIYIDFLSNGFKVRSTKEEVNDSGETYIFTAFAEQPFKFSNAR